MWKTVIMLLQVICFVLMAYLTIRFARSFWAQRSALGAVQEIFSQRNLAAAVYVIAGACTAAYGAMQALWMQIPLFALMERLPARLSCAEQRISL